MKKTIRKLQIYRETLREFRTLDRSELKPAKGGGDLVLAVVRGGDTATGAADGCAVL